MSSPSPLELARRLAALERQADQRSRASQLRYSSLDNGSLPVNDADGTVRQVIGQQPDGSYTITDLNGPPPATPMDPVVESLPGLLVVRFSGFTDDGSTWKLDFARVQVHATMLHGEIEQPANQVAEFTTTRGGVVSLALAAGTWWVSLVAVNTSGAKSDPTVQKSVVIPAPILSDGIKSFASDTAPTGLTADDAGSIWYDTANDNEPYRWTGTAWVTVRDATIAAARQVADQAQTDATSAGQSAAAAQQDATDAAAAAAAAQTDATNAANAAAGAQSDADAANAAAAAADAKAAQAVQDAADAATLAGTKNRTFFQDTAPTSPVEGDVWYDTANGYHPKRWNATTSTWDDVQDQAIIDAANAASAADAKAAQAQTDAATADSKAVQAQSDADAAATAASTADAKAVTAQQTADQAKSDAATADGKAVAAQSAADQAAADAAAADAKAVTAQGAADDAQTAADAAQARADAVRLMGANMVYDGGYENGADGKTLTSGGGTSVVQVVNDATAHGGTHYFSMTRNTTSPSYPGTSFPMKFEKDRKYAVELWARVPATVTAAQGLHIRVNFKKADGSNNWPTYTPSVPNDNVWRKYAFEFTTEGDCTNLDTTLWVQHNGDLGPDSPIHVDDVALYDRTEAAAAQAVADAAQAAADQAQTDADAASSAASAADAKAVQAQSDADAASSAAAAADAKAVQAQTDADAAATAASTADSKAVAAQTAADQAKSDAAAADSKAVAAQSAADTAQAAADAADNKAADAAALAGSKSKTWFQATAPTSPSDGDIWYDTDDKYRPRRWNASLATPAWEDVRDQAVLDAAAAASAAQDAANTADAKAVQAQTDADAASTAATAAQNAADTAQTAANTAQAAADAAQADATQALSDAATAKAIADGKITTFVTTLDTDPAPVADGVGDLWIDYANKLHRWDGSAWTPLQDAGIAQAIADASTAQTAADAAQSTADGKVVTFSGPAVTPPTAEGVGDLWIVTDQGNKLKRWSGSAWVDVQDSGIPQALSDAATASQDAANAASAASAAQGAADTAQQRADDAAAAAAAAQSTADGKIVTFFGPGEPVADGVGDLWIDTDNDNRVSRWDGTNWVPAPAGTNAINVAGIEPRNLQLGGTGGGIYDNLVADMQFAEPERRASRVAQAENSNGAWSFRQTSNLTPPSVANIGDVGVSLAQAQAAFTAPAGWHFEYADPTTDGTYNHGQNSWTKLVQDTPGPLPINLVLCSTTASIPVTEKETYTAEAAGLPEIWDGTSSSWWNADVRAQIRWLDGTGATISTSLGESSAYNLDNSTRMQPKDGGFVTAQAPVGAVAAKIELVNNTDWATNPVAGVPWTVYLGRNGPTAVERNGWAMWMDTAEVWPDEWLLEAAPSKMLYDADRAPLDAYGDSSYYSQITLAKDVRLPRGAVVWFEVLTSFNTALTEATTGNYQGIGLVYKYPDGSVAPPALGDNFDAWNMFSTGDPQKWYVQTASKRMQREVTVDIVLYISGTDASAPANARARFRFPSFGIIGYNNSASRQQIVSPENIQYLNDDGLIDLNLWAGNKGTSAAYDNILKGSSWVFADSGEWNQADPNYTGTDTTYDPLDRDQWEHFLWETGNDTNNPTQERGQYNLRHYMRVNANAYSASDPTDHPEAAGHAGAADDALEFLAGRNPDFTPKAKIKVRGGGASPLELEAPGGVKVLGDLAVTGDLPALSKHSDVADTAPATGDTLKWNAATGLWEPGPGVADLLASPVEVRPSQSLTLNGPIYNFQAVPGGSYTLDVKSTADVYEVEVFFDAIVNSGSGNVVVVCGIMVDGAANPGQCVIQLPAGGRTTIGSTYLLKDLSVGTHTVQLGMYGPSASSQVAVLSPHTGMVIKQLPNRQGDAAATPALFSATVRQVTAQTVGQAVYSPDWTYLNFGVQEEGTSGWSGGAPDRVLLPKAGQYSFSAGWAHNWASGTTLDCILGVTLYNADGTVAQAGLVEDRVNRPYTGSATVSGSVKCTAPNQYLRVYVFHDPGGTLSTVPGKCFLSVHQSS